MYKSKYNVTAKSTTMAGTVKFCYHKNNHYKFFPFTLFHVFCFHLVVKILLINSEFSGLCPGK